MVATWRRIAIGVGFALCGLLLTGCRAEGTIDILSEERVAVNLMVTSPDVDCPEAVDGLLLHITAATDASGLRTCHVFGESQAITLDQFGINLSTAAEYLVLQTNLSLGIDDLPACDIQIRFPGQVVTASQGHHTRECRTHHRPPPARPGQRHARDRARSPRAAGLDDGRRHWHRLRCRGHIADSWDGLARPPTPSSRAQADPARTGRAHRHCRGTAHCLRFQRPSRCQ